MDKHLGVFITLKNSHLHVSLNYAFNMITHHVTHLCMGHRGCVGIMLLGCYTDGSWSWLTNKIVFSSSQVSSE